MLSVLFLDKFADAKLLDVFQIIPCAHFKILSVTVIHAVDLLAGILAAFKTKRGIALGRVVDARAFFKQVIAPFVSWPAAGALAPFYIVDMSQITAANGAIHSARRDKVF